MAMITCDNGIPVEEVPDFGLVPSDITTGEYIFLNDCCRYGSEGSYVPISFITTMSGMEPGDLQDITISGGCPPYKWESVFPLTFTSLYTVSGSNTLYLSHLAEPQNEVSDYTIKDICYVQGSPASLPLAGNTAIVKDKITGDPWSIIFIANTPDCYIAGETSEIDLIVPYTITQVVVTNAGCSSTGLNPVLLTTPAGYTTTVSLSITMLAEDYEWADGSDVYGTTVMSVDVCVCEDNNITFTTQQMGPSEQQTLGVDNEWVDNCNRWEITDGLGSLGATAENGDVVYTAPSSSSNCDPTIITLFKEDVAEDTLSIEVSTYVIEDPGVYAYDIFTFDKCVDKPPYNFWCYVWLNRYGCQDELIITANPFNNHDNFPDPSSCELCMNWAGPWGDFNEEIAASPIDKREDPVGGMPGCCPAALE